MDWEQICIYDLSSLTLETTWHFCFLGITLTQSQYPILKIVIISFLSVSACHMSWPLDFWWKPEERFKYILTVSSFLSQFYTEETSGLWWNEQWSSLPRTGPFQGCGIFGPKAGTWEVQSPCLWIGFGLESGREIVTSSCDNANWISLHQTWTFFYIDLDIQQQAAHLFYS